MNDEKLPFEPPEPKYVSENYELRIPVTDKRLDDRWELRKYATKQLEKQIGDYVQVTSLKVKYPGRFSKMISRIKSREPEARLILTVKF